ncbi:MAG TPA: MFS transporter [Thermomicrobiales bacterium]|jgi:EmrB/QacA subfamily drug resistance transporter
MAARAGLANRVNDSNLKWYTLGAACFGLFMAILDNLVVNIAMPTIARDLDAKTTQLQWIVSAYTLVFASLQITAGGLGDRFGRKKLFLFGLTVFTATSFAAAFSQNIEMLIALRAAQGFGAAFIMPLSLSLISAAFPPEERGKAVGIWGAISVSGIALGPIVGGALVEYASWHWVFLINVPIGIGALFVTSAVVRESKDESGTVATDYAGTALITAGIASLTWGLIEASDRGWTDPLILTAFAAAAVIGAAFIWVEAHTERPMIPLRFFRSSTFTGANIDSFMIAFLITGVSFFMTLYQQNIHGFSPMKTGLALLPMVVVMMVLSPVTGTLTTKMGPRRLISFGMLVTGVGTLLMLLTGVDASYWAILPSFIVMGFGMSFIWAPMTTAVLNSVESEKSGVASAVNGALREIGTAFGVALLGTLASRAYQGDFKTAEQVESIRQGPSGGVLAPVLGLIGSGMSFGGRVIEDPRTIAQLGLPADALAQVKQALTPEVVAGIRQASAEAFMTGMDRAVIFSGVGIMLASVLSYFLVKDAVVAKPVEEAELVPERELVANVAD